MLTKYFKIAIYLFLVILMFFCYSTIYAQETYYIKVHFLYGSKPNKLYKHSEKKWFGGIKGGHVGIEVANNQVISFVPERKLHIFPHNTNKHGRFKLQSINDFYNELAGNLDSLKKTIISISIDCKSKHLLDSVTQSYLKNTPYDYAFLGMRCSSACYDILGQIGLVYTYPKWQLWYRIFYQKILRKKILKYSEKNKWIIEKYIGTIRRIWEKD